MSNVNFVHINQVKSVLQLFTVKVTMAPLILFMVHFRDAFLFQYAGLFCPFANFTDAFFLIRCSIS